MIIFVSKIFVLKAFWEAKVDEDELRLKLAEIFLHALTLDKNYIYCT